MEMTAELKEQFDLLNKNTSKILELEDDIQEGVAAGKAVAELKTKVEKRSLDNAEYVEQLKGLVAEARKEELKELREALTDRLDEMETNLSGRDVREGMSFAKTIAQKFGESDMTARGDGPSKLRQYAKGLSLKEITNVTDPGLVRPDFDNRIVGVQQQTPRVQDLVTHIRTSSDTVEYIRQDSDAIAEPQPGQGVAKHETNLTFSEQSEKVETIATWLPASSQILDDSVRLEDFIRTRLIMALLREVEQQMLSGDGTTNNFTGLLSQAEAYDTTLVTQLGVQSVTSIDDLRAAILQVQLNHYTPTGIVLNPFAWAAIELRKDANNQYIFTSPQNQTAPRLWGFPVVATTEIPNEDFVVGDFVQGATLYDRQDPSVQVSTEHADFFTRNMVAILAELRAAFAVNAPSAFVEGTLTVGS